MSEEPQGLELEEKQETVQQTEKVETETVTEKTETPADDGGTVAGEAGKGDDE